MSIEGERVVVFFFEAVRGVEAGCKKISVRDISHSGNVARLAQAIEKSATLLSLDLSYTKFADESAKALAVAVEKCVSLQTIHLSENQIGNEGAKALAIGIEKSRTLQTINLMSNKIGDDGARALAIGVEMSESLQTIHLSENKIGVEGAKALAIGVEKSRSLQLLDLDHNKIGDEGAKALAIGVEKSTSLQTVNLRNSQIGAEGAKALAIGVEKSRSLQLLDLAYNKIGDEGARALAIGVARSESLHTIHLIENNIGSEGAIALAIGVEESVTLRTVNLCYNEIGDDGAKAWASGIEKSRSLRTIDLSNNQIGDEGARALAIGVERSTLLQRLVLSNNEIGARGAIALAIGVEKSTSLQAIHLLNNLIGGEGARRLTESYLLSNAPLSIIEGFGNDNIMLMALPTAFTRSIESRANVRHRLEVRVKTPPAFFTLLDGWTRQLDVLHLPHITMVPALVVKRGPTAVEAFFRAVGDADASAPRRLVVSLVGSQCSGKTSLLHTLLDKNFHGYLVPDDENRSTLGAIFHPPSRRSSNRRQNEVIDVRESLLSFVDFGGQEDYEQTHALFHYNRGVTLIVVDLASYSWTPNSSEAEKYAHFWNRVGFYYEKVSAISPSCMFLIVGARRDMINDGVDVDERRRHIMESLDKLESDLRGRLRQEIEALPTGASKRRAELNQLLMARPRLIHNSVLVTSCKPVGGAEDAALGVPELDLLLCELASNSGEILPHGYVRLLDGIQRLQLVRKSLPLATLKEVMELARSIDADVFSGIEDVRAALDALRDAGEVLWYPHAPYRVFLRLNFLADVCKEISLHNMVGDTNEDGVLWRNLSNAKQHDSYKIIACSDFRRQGLLKIKDLITSFPAWQQLGNDTINVDTTIRLLERFWLAVKISRNGTDYLYVPYALQRYGESSPTLLPPKNAERRRVRKWVFPQFVPVWLLPSLVIAIRRDTDAGEKFYRVREREFLVRTPILITSSSSGGQADVVLKLGILRETASKGQVVAPAELVLEIWHVDDDRAAVVLRQHIDIVRNFIAETCPNVNVVEWAVDPKDLHIRVLADLIETFSSSGYYTADDGNAVDIRRLTCPRTTVEQGHCYFPYPGAETRIEASATVETFWKALFENSKEFFLNAVLTGSVARSTDLQHDIDVAVYVPEIELQVRPSDAVSGKETFRRRFYDKVETALSNRGLVPGTVRPQSHSVSFLFKIGESTNSVDLVPLIHLKDSNIEFVPNFEKNIWEPTCTSLIKDIPPRLTETESERLRWVVRAVKAWKSLLMTEVRKSLPMDKDVSLMPSTYLELFVRMWFVAALEMKWPVGGTTLRELLKGVMEKLADDLTGVQRGHLNLSYPGLEEMLRWWRSAGAAPLRSTVMDPSHLQKIKSMVSGDARVHENVARLLQDSAGVLGEQKMDGVVLPPLSSPALVGEVRDGLLKGFDAF